MLQCLLVSRYLRTSHRLSFLKCFSSPLQLLRPLFFLFSVFIIAPQRKIDLDEKRSKKRGKREWKKWQIFQKTHQHTTLKSYYPLSAERHCGIESSDPGANLQQRVHCAPKRATWGLRGPRKDKGGLPTTDPERPLTPWPLRVNGGPAESEREAADVWKSPDGGFLGLARHR